jgi:hypothetical protein
MSINSLDRRPGRSRSKWLAAWPGLDQLGRSIDESRLSLLLNCSVDHADCSVGCADGLAELLGRVIGLCSCVARSFAFASFIH